MNETYKKEDRDHCLYGLFAIEHILYETMKKNNIKGHYEVQIYPFQLDITVS